MRSINRAHSSEKLVATWWKPPLFTCVLWFWRTWTWLDLSIDQVGGAQPSLTSKPFFCSSLRFRKMVRAGACLFMFCFITFFSCLRDGFIIICILSVSVIVWILIFFPWYITQITAESQILTSVVFQICCGGQGRCTSGSVRHIKRKELRIKGGFIRCVTVRLQNRATEPEPVCVSLSDQSEAATWWTWSCTLCNSSSRLSSLKYHSVDCSWHYLCVCVIWYIVC